MRRARRHFARDRGRRSGVRAAGTGAKFMMNAARAALTLTLALPRRTYAVAE
jgi:hypothetical protein